MVLSHPTSQGWPKSKGLVITISTFMNHSPTYYELLKLKPEASTTDLLAAYHAAKMAGSQIPAEDARKGYLTLIERAHETLADPLKRKQYDDLLSWPETEPGEEKELEGEASTSTLSGAKLSQIRRQRNLSLDDVYRITRIPLKYLKALEEDLWDEMPARVYIQGFIKNLAHTYKLPPQETVETYLKHFDSAISQSV